MIDYGPPPAGRQQPGRRPPPGRPTRARAGTWIVAIVAIAAALATAHVLTSHPAPARQHLISGPVEIRVRPLRLGACIDPTSGSTIHRQHDGRSGTASNVPLNPLADPLCGITP